LTITHDIRMIVTWLRRTVTVTDDIDGSANASEVSFSYRGTNYTIDLGKKNLTAFDKAMKPYIDAATKVPARGRAASVPTRGRRGAPASRGDARAIRVWAAENGHSVPARGRIPAAVREAYEAAR
jgi:Lsr2